MKNLPSEQKALLEKSIEEWEQDGELDIFEPCDCGSRIQHNNGGNYHDLIYLRRDEGKVFVKFETTCELTPPAEWEEITEEKAIQVIEQNSDWL